MVQLFRLKESTFLSQGKNLDINSRFISCAWSSKYEIIFCWLFIVIFYLCECCVMMIWHLDLSLTDNFIWKICLMFYIRGSCHLPWSMWYLAFKMYMLRASVPLWHYTNLNSKWLNAMMNIKPHIQQTFFYSYVKFLVNSYTRHIELEYRSTWELGFLAGY